MARGMMSRAKDLGFHELTPKMDDFYGSRVYALCFYIGSQAEACGCRPSGRDEAGHAPCNPDGERWNPVIFLPACDEPGVEVRQGIGNPG
jgi:hypothetical protein